MKLLVSAFEKSANLHLRHLLPHLQADIVGIFDQRLGEPLIDMQSLAIMGFKDVIAKIPFFFQLQKRMIDLAKDVDKVLLIDASGFNLPLAKSIKKRYPHKEIIYYILPQAWAWRKGRIKTVQTYVDKALSILPFEKEYYDPLYNITYVGHPLLDEIERLREKPAIQGPLVFMPGSRAHEIRSLMPIFKEVRKKIDKEALLVVPDHLKNSSIQELYGDVKDFVITYDAHEALLEGSFAFVCSGTATLEASLIGTPLALCYIAKPLDYHIAKTFVHLRHVGLANIMLGDVHPEFLQHEVTVQNLLQAYENRDPERFLRKSLQLRSYLQHGSAQRVAQEIHG